MLFVSPKIKVDFSSIHGRGVFATSDIMSGEIIEECHFVKIGEPKFELLDPEIKKISFAWPKGSNNCHVIVLGFGSIYNHSDNNNAIWITDPIKNCFTFLSVKDIRSGEEICTNYLNTRKVS